MKLILFTTLICLLSGFVKPTITTDDYNDFLKYAGKQFNPSDAIKNNCEWQYAVVQVNTNLNNKIVSYTILNNAHEDFKKGFGFLIGYQFPAKLPINKHPIVFCISIENQKLNCMTSRKQYSPSEVLGRS
jgi:hypothetical protein